MSRCSFPESRLYIYVMTTVTFVFSVNSSPRSRLSNCLLHISTWMAYNQSQTCLPQFRLSLPQTLSLLVSTPSFQLLRQNSWSRRLFLTYSYAVNKSCGCFRIYRESVYSHPFYLYCQALPSVTSSLYYHKCLFQFSSLAQSCTTLCNPMNCSTPGFPILHQLPELAQTHVYRVGDVTQPSHPLSSPSPPAFSLSQHQGLF